MGRTVTKAQEVFRAQTEMRGADGAVYQPDAYGQYADGKRGMFDSLAAAYGDPSGMEHGEAKKTLKRAGLGTLAGLMFFPWAMPVVCGGLAYLGWKSFRSMRATGRGRQMGWLDRLANLSGARRPGSMRQAMLSVAGQTALVSGAAALVFGAPLLPVAAVAGSVLLYKKCSDMWKARSRGHLSAHQQHQGQPAPGICSAQTIMGEPCRRQAAPGFPLCHQHILQMERGGSPPVNETPPVNESSQPEAPWPMSEEEALVLEEKALKKEMSKIVQFVAEQTGTNPAEVAFHYEEMANHLLENPGEERRAEVVEMLDEIYGPENGEKFCQVLIDPVVDLTLRRHDLQENRRCQGKTHKGKRCKFLAPEGEKFCKLHAAKSKGSSEDSSENSSRSSSSSKKSSGRSSGKTKKQRTENQKMQDSLASLAEKTGADQKKIFEDVHGLLGEDDPKKIIASLEEIYPGHGREIHDRIAAPILARTSGKPEAEKEKTSSADSRKSKTEDQPKRGARPGPCQAIASSTGQPCSMGAMPGSKFCPWHLEDMPASESLVVGARAIRGNLEDPSDEALDALLSGKKVTDSEKRKLENMKRRNSLPAATEEDRRRLAKATADPDPETIASIFQEKRFAPEERLVALYEQGCSAIENDVSDIRENVASRFEKAGLDRRADGIRALPDEAIKEAARKHLHSRLTGDAIEKWQDDPATYKENRTAPARESITELSQAHASWNDVEQILAPDPKISKEVNTLVDEHGFDRNAVARFVWGEIAKPSSKSLRLVKHSTPGKSGESSGAEKNAQRCGDLLLQTLKRAAS